MRPPIAAAGCTSTGGSSEMSRSAAGTDRGDSASSARRRRSRRSRRSITIWARLMHSPEIADRLTPNIAEALREVECAL
jgi:hypothetical protein